MTSATLWNYHKVNDDANENNPAGTYSINNKTTTSKSFEYKTKITVSTPADNSKLDTEVVAPLKYLSNFWRSLDLPLISCEIELDLRWAKNCVISETSRTAATAGDNPVEATTTTSAIFQINNAKLYVPAITLSVNDNIRFLENIEQWFKRTVSGNKYRSEITTQAKKDNLDYIIDPTFRNINRSFVNSFKNGDSDPTRNPFGEYYKPLVEINDFNALIEKKSFSDQPVKNKQKAYENFKKQWPCKRNFITLLVSSKLL